jgi:Uma2 family endonuclease
LGSVNESGAATKLGLKAVNCRRFVLEITSLTTKQQDEEAKPRLYASLGIQEYFQYDPTGDYLNPQLKGKQLVNGSYEPIQSATYPMEPFRSTVKLWV